MDDTMIKAFFTLGISVAVIALILFFVKKMVIKKNLSSSGIELKVISRITLQPKTHLYIVKADEKTLLIGANDHAINLVSDLTDDPTFGGAVDIRENNDLRKELARQAKEEEKIKFEMEKNLSFGSFLMSAFKKSN